MKVNVKLHLVHYFTNADTYGNVYHAVRINNIKNGLGFLVEVPCLSNVTNILCEAFNGWENCQYIISKIPTNSASYTSLPEDRLFNLNPCEFRDGKPYKGSWKRELNKIGFRLPRKERNVK